MRYSSGGRAFNAAFRINLAAVLGDLQRPREAIEQLQLAISLHGGNRPELHNNIGVAHERLGELREAAESYRKALAIDPNYADPHAHLGNVLRKVVVARFTRTLGTLLGSGVPILDGLEIVAKTAGNVVVMKGIMYAREKISEGRDLAGPLAETRVFPPMAVQMMGVGEQTGAMDAMLQKIADFYEDEVDVAVAALTKVMEPLMMVFLGGIVGGLIVAMYLPIFELADNIK